MNEEASQIRLKRLRYRSWHRGCKETDLVLGGFAEQNLGRLEAPLLDAYEALLDEDDALIWEWLIGKSSPKSEYQPLITLMRQIGTAH